jgi:hypothetical protein
LVKDATLDGEALNVFAGSKENVFKKEWKREPWDMHCMRINKINKFCKKDNKASAILHGGGFFKTKGPCRL